MSSAVARQLTVHGLVQGVFFRANTREQADAHGVVGWVANRPDGTVEAWLEGPEEAVAAVEDWVRAGGPPRAQVERVDAVEVPPAGHRQFDVRH